MAKLTNGKFTHARFLSSNRNWLTAIWLNEDDNTYLQLNIQADLESENYRKLLEDFSVDEIATMTDEFAKEEAEGFTAFVKELALENGLLYNPEGQDGIEKLLLDHIFEPPENEIGTDLLFNIKLKIFDITAVVESENAELKKALREAKTPLEAFYIAGKFLYE